MADLPHDENRPVLPAGVSSAAPNCPLEKAINTIGGRWKMLVLRVLILDGELRFNALLRAIPGISPKELTRNLRELEAAGLVARRTQVGAANYILTNLGKTMLPVFRELGAFGSRLMQRPDTHADQRAPELPPD
jgi:DNA-binding HxlR family transcriptional regulator